MNALQSPDRHGPPRTPSGFAVLVADDDDANRRLLQALFESCGAAVTLAQDGVEAVILARQSFDLICLDRHMPRMTGDDAAREIRAAFAGGGRPFLLLCTSDPDVGGAQGLFDAVAPKPVSIRTLLAAVVQTIEFRRCEKSSASVTGSLNETTAA